MNGFIIDADEDEVAKDIEVYYKGQKLRGVTAILMSTKVCLEEMIGDEE